MLVWGLLVGTQHCCMQCRHITCLARAVLEPMLSPAAPLIAPTSCSSDPKVQIVEERAFGRKECVHELMSMLQRYLFPNLLYFLFFSSFSLTRICFLLDLLARGSIWWCAVHLVAAYCELMIQANLALSSFHREAELLIEWQLRCLFWTARRNWVRSEYKGHSMNTFSLLS